MSKMGCDTRENVRFLSENGKSFWLRGSSWRSGTAGDVGALRFAVPIPVPLS